MKSQTTILVTQFSLKLGVACSPVSDKISNHGIATLALVQRVKFRSAQLPKIIKYSFYSPTDFW